MCVGIYTEKKSTKKVDQFISVCLSLDDEIVISNIIFYTCHRYYFVPTLSAFACEMSLPIACDSAVPPSGTSTLPSSPDIELGH